MHKRIDPFEFLYFLGCTIKKKYLLSKQKRLPCKVFSIGNITMGGAGKTPVTIALADEAKRRGFMPVILTRGYKGKSKEPVLINFPQKQFLSVDKRASTILSPETIGDEAFMMSEKRPDIPIVKFPDRYRGGMLALEKLKSHVQIHQIVFILDDGFQHWSLYRDIDIVLVDGINPFGNRKMLPFGVLRELPYELKRADILVITKRRNEELFSKLKLINPKAPVFNSEYKVIDIKNFKGGRMSAWNLKGKKVYAFCGIAQPESFRDIISSFEANLCVFREFPDHYSYKEKDIADIKKQFEKRKCDILMTTEKDMVKLKQFNLPDTICYVDIELSIDLGFYEEIFKGVR